MTHPYKSLTQYTIAKAAKLHRRGHNRPTNVTLENPARVVMTDLSDTLAFTIEAKTPIDSTNDKMIACGVRLLFVTENDNSIVGIVTAVDILGEKPVQIISATSRNRNDIMTQDIMTAKDKLEVIKLSDVDSATVGDIVETIKTIRRQHLLVIETNGVSDIETIRGIFSTSQIGRQLGMNIEPSNRVDTFAELEKVLLSK